MRTTIVRAHPPLQYRLTSGSPEGGSVTVLEHDQVFSADELKALMDAALTAAGKATRRRDLAFFRECLADYLADPHPDPTQHRRDVQWARKAIRSPSYQVEELWTAAIDLLIELHGFRRPVWTAQAHYDAWDRWYPRFEAF